MPPDPTPRPADPASPEAVRGMDELYAAAEARSDRARMKGRGRYEASSAEGVREHPAHPAPARDEAVELREAERHLHNLRAHISARQWRADDIIDSATHISRLLARARHGRAETQRLRELEAACHEVLRRWTFDDRQQHTHTWHDMQDCAAMIRAALAPGGGRDAGTKGAE